MKKVFRYGRSGGTFPVKLVARTAAADVCAFIRENASKDSTQVKVMVETGGGK